MNSQIHVATRKGLFTFERSAGQNVNWSIGEVSFLAVPVTMSLFDVRSGYTYAALDHGHFGTKLHRRDAGSRQWKELAVPRFPEGATVPHRMADQAEGGEHNTPPNKPASLSEIWCLETGGSDEPGVLWAGTIPGGLFRSADHGESWHLVESLWERPERQHWFGGGKDDPGIHSICIDPRDSRHMSLAVSCGGVWVTRDGGDSWDCRSEGLRAEYMPPDQAYNPVIQDAHRMVCCRADPELLWIQHHNGIFHSRDGCASWREIEGVQPSSFGFAVAVHPQNGNTAWFVPAIKDELRVPTDARLVVTKTDDGGKSFAQLMEGLPDRDTYDVVYRHALDVDATGERLAFGSTTGNLWASEDGGERWHNLSTNLPPVYAVRFLQESG